MSSTKLSNDARDSVAGLLYQLYIALAKCFEMGPDQKVLIEKQGDVTLFPKEQIETKRHARPLTDNDCNFWGTLSNWMSDGFDDTQYSSLILLTTQSIGRRSAFAKWNEVSLAERIAILTSIRDKNESRQKQKDRNGEPASGLRILQLQRDLLNPARRPTLERVVRRLVVTADSPSSGAVYNTLLARNCYGILKAKRDEYLEALLGFVLKPQTFDDNDWEITHAQFEAKVMDLTSRLCRQTVHFPLKYIGRPVGSSTHAPYRDAQFIRLIHDIEYHNVVPQAIRDYLAASDTVRNEFQNYELSPDTYVFYVDEVLQRFRPRFTRAKRNVTDVVKDSQSFYDDIIGSDPPVCDPFHSTPIEFRNGVLHMEFDRDGTDLKWRLD